MSSMPVYCEVLTPIRLDLVIVLSCIRISIIFAEECISTLHYIKCIRSKSGFINNEGTTALERTSQPGRSVFLMAFRQRIWDSDIFP